MDCDGPKHALVRDIDGRFVSTQSSQGSIIPMAEIRYRIIYQHTLPAPITLVWTCSQYIVLCGVLHA